MPLRCGTAGDTRPLACVVMGDTAPRFDISGESECGEGRAVEVEPSARLEGIGDAARATCRPGPARTSEWRRLILQSGEDALIDSLGE
jgi:hypothetical protein